MKIIIQPDIQKAKALVTLAKLTLERLKELKIEKYPSNTLIDYYDTLHKLMEALSLENGVKFKGESAHQELINYICENKIITSTQTDFLQQMREYRNRISYEGLIIPANYITFNKAKIEEIILILISYFKINQKC